MTVLIDQKRVLDGLMDFQQKTVEKVFSRFYLDDDPAKRFLVADEVGLGKTLVAKGVIARVIDHLSRTKKRINIVYVCSNSAIAKQNVSRLNVVEGNGFSLASRLTLLPLIVKDLRSNQVNFVSFTPNTAFNLRSSGGIAEERLLLFHALSRLSEINQRGLKNLLQGNVERMNWNGLLRDRSISPDETLIEEFVSAVRRDERLWDELSVASKEFEEYVHINRIQHEKNTRRFGVIGKLRQLLAKTCLGALEPDMIILDEFQRFRNLLTGNDGAAELASELFEFQDEATESRVLLLSATPYKMLTMDHESEQDHYDEFVDTIRFLAGDEKEVDALQSNIRRFRSQLLHSHDIDSDSLLQTKRAIESSLKRWMSRTERSIATTDGEDMTREVIFPAPLNAEELRHARAIDGIATEVDATDVVEYWKSSPYLLNFMKKYRLRNLIGEAKGEVVSRMEKLARKHRSSFLKESDFANYKKIPHANGRLTNLVSQTIDQGLWEVLWIAPSFPSWKLRGAYARANGTTKALVFSAWNVVPDAISTMCSYEAERRIVRSGNRKVARADLYAKSRPLLRFTKSVDGRVTGMPALSLLYPSPSLAELVDPISVGVDLGEVPDFSVVRKQAEELLSEELSAITAEYPEDGVVDQRWYWAAPVLIDKALGYDVNDWLSDLRATWIDGLRNDNPEEAHIVDDHMGALQAVYAGELTPKLGKPPKDLIRVLSLHVLGNPAVLALRSLRRQAPDLSGDDYGLMLAASLIASGFRSLFNLPDSINLLGARRNDRPYWRTVLEHCVDGCLSATLDEYFHMLRDSLGVSGDSDSCRVSRIAEAASHGVTLRTSRVQVDSIKFRPRRQVVDIESFNIRSRFALRFAETSNEEGASARRETVLSAFNSPFKPFVMASTSIGQEGLDFHAWCHAVVHWNLPSNPADLEQREGRVHRFKGHGIRKNVAMDIGYQGLDNWKAGQDPWDALFDQARARRPSGTGDLVPYWIYPVREGASVERRIYNFPLSRENARLKKIKSDLAAYRMVFGQPRQQDLLQYLERFENDRDSFLMSREWKIDLTP